MRIAAVLGLLVLLTCSPRIPPEPTEWVTDPHNLLTWTDRADLSVRLNAYYKKSGHVLLVWIGTSTRGEDPDAYCGRLFNAWGVGRMGKDDGVVLFIFPQDDMRWIFVGYGLTSALTDRESTHIARNIMAPLMREGKDYQAVTLGVDLIIAELDAADQGEIDHHVKPASAE